MRLRYLPLSWLALAIVPYGLVGLRQADQKPDFQRDAMGVFRAYCITCHSGQGAPAGLDLSTVEGIRKGGVSGPLFVPGKPDSSLLIRRLRGLDGKPMMPKGFASIGDEKIDAIRRWIADGAVTKESGRTHWAYLTPKRPAVPSTSNPKWIRNPIDAFVLARLDREGLRPTSEAEPGTLYRRASLDLIGMPPTVEEMRRYLADFDPKKYDKAIDRLLASPHYGERQARIWLDLARYADTHGYEADRSRTAYKYRDWVIDAFNRNLPYDQFSIEQLAGDLLPNPGLDDRIATGFHRNSMFNEEGGVDPEESMFETVLDRVGTTSTVWMGSTLACARCHDHKFDPFSQRDFYKMYAYFGNNTYAVAGDNNVGQRKFYEPTIKTPSADQIKRQGILKERIAALRQKSAKNPPDVAGFIAEARAAEWWTPFPKIVSLANGEFERQQDGSFLAKSPAPGQDTYRIELEIPDGRWTAMRLEVMPDPSLPMKGPGRASSGNFILTKAEIEVGDKPVDFTVDASYTQPGYDLTSLKDGRRESGGWAIAPNAGKKNELLFTFEKPQSENEAELTLEMNSKTWPQHTIGRFRVSLTTAGNPGRLAMTEEVRKAVFAEHPTKEQLDLIAAHLAKYDPIRKEIALTQVKLDRLNGEIPTAMVMSDRPAKGPLMAYVHRRGEFLQKGEQVAAGTPEFLPKPTGGNRLDLAKWLFSKEHPLTARVQVNRMWSAYFGRGIVETEEDFGTQGSKPSHPELLDWLACELRDGGWNLKHIHRLIVTSATYRQSSNASKALVARDPQNVLLARGPRFRMEAEMIRDTALRAAGLLDERVGGPSVMPYQPDNIWDSPYSGEAWNVATGADRYRRGLYVFWKRTAPYPSFMALDATSRESCTVRRIRTNTPLQALALLNDRAYVECASALASRVEAQTPKEGIESAFLACTGRMPTSAERARLAALLRDLQSKYRANTKDAEKLVQSTGSTNPKPKSVADRAAWTMLCNVLLNLDETITKG